MKLADYMYKHGITPAQLRRMLGVRSRATISRYLSGDRIPSHKIRLKIQRLTNGQVTLEDLLDTSPPKCAIVVEMPGGTLSFPNRNSVFDLTLGAIRNLENTAH